MNAPLVLGAILRIDLRGWSGPPPRLPAEPVRAETSPSGLSCFFYDLMPRRALVAAPQAAERIGMILEGLLEDWPFRDLPFPARCSLDLGLTIDDPAAAWSTAWPAAFLAALADADIELRLSVYPGSAGS